MMKTEKIRLEEKLKHLQEDINNKNSLIETLVNYLSLDLFTTIVEAYLSMNKNC